MTIYTCDPNLTTDYTKVSANRAGQCVGNYRLYCSNCGSTGYVAAGGCEHGLKVGHYFCQHSNDMPKDYHEIDD